jgi:2-iminobutanoate/2-iminopropanoate deaminase
MSKRRAFLKSAAGFGGGAAFAAMSAAAAESPVARSRVAGGIRVGNLFFAGGLQGVNPERRRNPSVPAGDIKEQTTRAMEAHKKNLEAIGSSLENVLKVTVFMADIKNERAGMNEAYAKFFPKDAPARSAIGIMFPSDDPRVEIELIAWIPDK